jgi:hypothetical protein
MMAADFNNAPTGIEAWVRGAKFFRYHLDIYSVPGISADHQM